MYACVCVCVDVIETIRNGQIDREKRRHLFAIYLKFLKKFIIYNLRLLAQSNQFDCQLLLLFSYYSLSFVFLFAFDFEHISNIISDHIDVVFRTVYIIIICRVWGVFTHNVNIQNIRSYIHKMNRSYVSKNWLCVCEWVCLRVWNGWMFVTLLRYKRSRTVIWSLQTHSNWICMYT